MAHYPGDVLITGALSAGNLQTVRVTITPEPNVPTSVEISGLNLRGRGPVQAIATAHSSVPGTHAVEVSVSSVTSTGCLVWLCRTNATATHVSVVFWREP
ncbi:hypothetical protein BJF83_20915 [Nocardiopsis sp. CNR-923]|uniref:hypothetical protein n=1 Tax=Nocardiopsis sp. CNR-923 TaxID=1904965 RepID=UPI00095FED46|nr:hypothetical protein [Nocardiopsis sp. CNR-923]OLT26549.1 hypothetical protein BJF83_20915 [Nocardiopsis sp. CNR-923]